MRPRVAAAIFCMGNAITRDMATHWARLAAERGATPDELAEAWRVWEAAQDDYVQTVGWTE